MYFGNCQTVGTCSICGGPVQVPVAWWSIVPPTPTCAHCGAVKQANHGPVMDMKPHPVATTASTIFISTSTRESHLERYQKQWRALKVRFC